ncbi:hypothetical protein SAMN05216188_13088 [Lentzea xinjiangensis]|uniref:CAAX prenyl protease 2/Lysostaphin resistance protein A-like domain-containing protein n=1 Tax=Lentzea xinjiangensis TaxID=402600 RepID=A0A1H9W5P2_9PSEU|nr:CPBP family glutamic-type intramembrane protease [Lentzea xinjiangensis]SES28987.1 hypothetical protein SAMN05216188_13088 [Lentzea xinjiangensis]
MSSDSRTPPATAEPPWKRGVTGLLYPGTATPAHPAPITWTRQRSAWVMMAGIPATLFFSEVWNRSFSLFNDSTGLHLPLPPTLLRFDVTPIGEAKRVVFLMLLAVLVLVCLHSIGGRQAMGLDERTTPRDHIAAFGYYLRLVCPAAIIGFIVVRAAELAWPSLQPWTGAQAVWPGWLETLRSIGSGFCEEVIATVLICVILEHVRRRGGRTWVGSGIGAVLVVAVHLSYHLHYGLRALVLVIPVYLTVLCWRHTRSLPGIVLGHIAYNLMADLNVNALLALVAFVVVGSLLDNRWWRHRGWKHTHTGPAATNTASGGAL